MMKNTPEMNSLANDVINGIIRDEAEMQEQIRNEEFAETLADIDPERMARDEDCISDDNWACGTLDPET